MDIYAQSLHELKEYLRKNNKIPSEKIWNNYALELEDLDFLSVEER